MAFMSNKLAMAAIGLWVVTAVGAGTLFIKGRTAPSSDGRTAILLSGAERDFVLREMRTMLISVQQITQALSQGDHAKAADAARKSSHHDASGMPMGLMAKLPLDFKQTGMAMHAGFGDFAKAAEQREASSVLYGKLADEMSACVGCHESYRIDLDR